MMREKPPQVSAKWARPPGEVSHGASLEVEAKRAILRAEAGGDVHPDPVRFPPVSSNHVQLPTGPGRRLVRFSRSWEAIATGLDLAESPRV